MLDLDHQLLELFKKEEIYAFCDFHLLLADGETATGLCKISKPKAGKQQSQYFSLFFLIDSPTEAIWEKIDTVFHLILWNRLADRLPGVDAVLAIPHSHSIGGLYFQEIDVYLTKGEYLSKSYLSATLIPEVVSLIGCRRGELVFWEDRSSSTSATIPPGTVRPSETDRMLTQRLREFLGV
jgi:hypothetical protein